MLNLPPDRTMYGRAFWTYMHTVSVYLPHTPDPDQLAAFKGEHPQLPYSPCLSLLSSRPSHSAPARPHVSTPRAEEASLRA